MATTTPPVAPAAPADPPSSRTKAFVGQLKTGIKIALGVIAVLIFAALGHVVFALAVGTATVMVVARPTGKELAIEGYPAWEAIYAVALTFLTVVALGGLVFTDHVTLSAIAAWIVFAAAVAKYGRPGLWQAMVGVFLVGALVMALFGLHIPAALGTVLGLIPGTTQVAAAILLVVVAAAVAIAAVALHETWERWQEPDQTVLDDDVADSSFGQMALRFHRHRHLALAVIGAGFLVIQGLLIVWSNYSSGTTGQLDCNGPCPTGVPQLQADHHLHWLQGWHIVLLLAVGVVFVLESQLSRLARAKETTEDEETRLWREAGAPAPDPKADLLRRMVDHYLRGLALSMFEMVRSYEVFREGYLTSLGTDRQKVADLGITPKSVKEEAAKQAAAVTGDPVREPRQEVLDRLVQVARRPQRVVTGATRWAVPGLAAAGVSESDLRDVHGITIRDFRDALRGSLLEDLKKVIEQGQFPVKEVIEPLKPGHTPDWERSVTDPIDRGPNLAFAEIEPKSVLFELGQPPRRTEVEHAQDVLFDAHPFGPDGKWLASAVLGAGYNMEYLSWLGITEASQSAYGTAQLLIELQAAQDRHTADPAANPPVVARSGKGGQQMQWVPSSFPVAGHTFVEVNDLYQVDPRRIQL